jgi:hypothetical protein
MELIMKKVILFLLASGSVSLFSADNPRFNDFIVNSREDIPVEEPQEQLLNRDGRIDRAHNLLQARMFLSHLDHLVPQQQDPVPATNLRQQDPDPAPATNLRRPQE